MAFGVRTSAYAHVVRLALVALAAFAIWRQVATLHWTDVAPLVHSYRWSQLALAISLTAVSFLLLGAIEILALGPASGEAGHVPRRRALATAFVSHALSQALGVALLTGTAVRLRAYARHGVGALAVTRITAFVTVAIVLGLLTVGAIALLLGIAGSGAGIAQAPARPIGGALALIVLCSLAWSVLARKASPSIAAAQIGLSAFDWLLTATILFILLPPVSPFGYLTFIGACLLAHTFGMLSHVPGGAGVFEASMFTLLAGDLGHGGRGALAASLVAYRVVYYVLPLGAAALVAVMTTRRAQSSTAVAPSPHRSGPDEAWPSPPTEIEWLIDNAAAYDSLLRSIATAQRSIWMTQLAFDADCRAYRPDGRVDVIAEALLAAVLRGPVEVRILLNETFLLDTARPLRRFFAQRLGAAPRAPGAIEIRGVSSFPRLLHAKMVVVDGTEAFLLGSPFVNGYWDDERHQPVDTRRPLRELGGRPLHDLSVRMTGTPIAGLERLFTELWAIEGPPERRPSAKEPVRVVSTSPRGVLRHRPAGATEILDALLEGIAAARSLIYIEHQYLSSRRIAAALEEALRREARLEIVAVLNENADVTAYRRWQNARLRESGLMDHPRVGLFSLWSSSRRPGGAELNQVFVHSKVVAVDDAWATTGSANLDGVSLHSYGDDFSGVGRRVFRHTRNFDVNLVVEGTAAARLRTRLWAEHLGAASGSLDERPGDGWLALWRGRAAANVAALNTVQSPAGGPGMTGFVLPYSIEPTPARQLADVGVRVDPARLGVRFDPGWLEVHFSPNWVRNMFS